MLLNFNLMLDLMFNLRLLIVGKLCLLTKLLNFIFRLWLFTCKIIIWTILVLKGFINQCLPFDSWCGFCCNFWRFMLFCFEGPYFVWLCFLSIWHRSWVYFNNFIFFVQHICVIVWRVCIIIKNSARVTRWIHSGNIILITWKIRCVMCFAFIGYYSLTYLQVFNGLVANILIRYWFITWTLGASWFNLSKVLFILH